MTIVESQTDDSSTSIISPRPIAMSIKLESQQDVEATENITSFNGSILQHPSFISPIHMANLPHNILEHLQQQNNGGGMNIITSLPSPHTAASISPNNTIVDFNQQLQAPLLAHQSQQQRLPAAKKSDNKETKGLTTDERRQRRLLRNRLAAKGCRKKKKEYISQMQDTITRLQDEQKELSQQVDDLKRKISQLPQEMMNSNDNYKLMKEVTELNAKLGNIK